MAKKIRRMRTFARTAAKSVEKKLVENILITGDDGKYKTGITEKFS